MIRRPPRSTRTDTLLPYNDALPISSRRLVRRPAAAGGRPLPQPYPARGDGLGAAPACRSRQPVGVGRNDRQSRSAPRRRGGLPPRARRVRRPGGGDELVGPRRPAQAGGGTRSEEGSGGDEEGQ